MVKLILASILVTGCADDTTTSTPTGRFVVREHGAQSAELIPTAAPPVELHASPCACLTWGCVETLVAPSVGCNVNIEIACPDGHDVSGFVECQTPELVRGPGLHSVPGSP
jgi:hypothetical protein